eukprot:scaffold93748_cov33-Phaeocystis_antarctica.AAC.1
MVGSTGASLLVYVDDHASAASRAAAQLARLRPALATIALPVELPASAISWVGELSLSALRRWQQTSIALCVLAWGAAAGLGRFI